MTTTTTNSNAQLSLGILGDSTHVAEPESFHNTVYLEGERLEKAEEQCKSQEDRILRIFAAYGGQMTPFDVITLYNRQYAPVPITSIRRAISNLTKDGKLSKCDRMKDEMYGKPNHYWRLPVVNRSF